MLTKKQVLASIKDLPDSFSVDDLIDRVILLQKIEEGLEQSAKGQTVSTADAKKQLEKWLK
jgi:predicted transcriptional regulator